MPGNGGLIKVYNLITWFKLCIISGENGLSLCTVLYRACWALFVGFVYQGRSHLNHEKEEFAHEHPHIKTLEEVVKTVKPTAIIGSYALYCTELR